MDLIWETGNKPQKSLKIKITINSRHFQKLLISSLKFKEKSDLLIQVNNSIKLSQRI